MAAYCVFSPDGVMDQVYNVPGQPKPTARDYFGTTVTTDRPIGVYRSQECLPESKLQLVCSSSRLIDGSHFRVDSIEEIRARAQAIGIRFAEQRAMEFSGQILVFREALAFLGSDARPAMAKAMEDVIEARARCLRIMRGEQEPDIAIDPNLERIAGEVFEVRLDPAVVA